MSGIGSQILYYARGARTTTWESKHIPSHLTLLWNVYLMPISLLQRLLSSNSRNHRSISQTIVFHSVSRTRRDVLNVALVCSDETRSSPVADRVILFPTTPCPHFGNSPCQNRPSSCLVEMVVMKRPILLFILQEALGCDGMKQLFVSIQSLGPAGTRFRHLESYMSTSLRYSTLPG